MKDRIQQIMQNDGLSSVDFAKKIEISTSSLSHIFNGRNNPSLDVVMHIHKAYPEESLNWLLYGEGPMWNSASPASPTDDNEQVMDLFTNPSENREKPTNRTNDSEFRKETASETPSFAPQEIVKQEIKYIEKPQPKITEIRIFFDNGTYEVFTPDHSTK